MKRVVGYSALAFAVVFGAVTLALRYDRNQSLDQAVRSLQSSELPVVSVQNAAGNQTLADFRGAAKKLLPSVVSIETAARGRSVFSREVSLFPAGSGSGVVLSQDGLIVTNNHVVTIEARNGVRTPADAVRVELSDGKSFEAKIIGLDPRADIALLKIDATGLTPIEIAPASSVEVGQWVMALGNPMGYQNTLSVGVVSSLGRSLPTDQGGSVLIDAIQTDAAINPGNSGGALCDAQGRLIGINTAIISQTGGSIGLGFSIPTSRVERSVRDLQQYGYVRYAGLGVSLPSNDFSLAIPMNRQRLQQELRLTNALPSEGLVIIDADANGPAGKAGMRAYSILMSINGNKINGLEDYHQTLLKLQPGDDAKLRFWIDGNIREATVVLADVGRG
ncbi:MAG: trypsin-like peptidase domain-containing protein [Fimbriimonadaceae bacterium]|nr:trypsin-like peptidase domain-containing protein [Fimbriimonadaceae bacterium]